MPPPNGVIIRFLENADELETWARVEGFSDLRPTVWHLTVTKFSDVVPALDRKGVQVDGDVGRTVARLGGLIALCFSWPALVARHVAHLRAGGMWEYPTYRPHVSFTPDDGRALQAIRPFSGRLVFGPEIIG